jgi:hypothetical protein
MTITLDVTAIRGPKPKDETISSFWSMGDVNKDSAIDFADLSKAAKAFGATPDSPNWDADCDINGDKVIDLRDLTIAAHNYGKTIAPGTEVAVECIVYKNGETFQSGITPFKVDLEPADYIVEAHINPIKKYEKTFTVKAEETGEYKLIFYLIAPTGPLGFWSFPILISLATMLPRANILVEPLTIITKPTV